MINHKFLQEMVNFLLGVLLKFILLANNRQGYFYLSTHYVEKRVYLGIKFMSLFSFWYD